MVTREKLLGGLLVLSLFGCGGPAQLRDMEGGEGGLANTPRPGFMAVTPTSTPQPAVASSFFDLSYLGGKVVSNVKVAAVSWNGEVNPTISAGLPDFYRAVVSGPYF